MPLELRADAEETARRLVAAMAAQGPPADLTEAVTGPMPERLLTVLFAVPAADFGRLQTWREVLLSSDRSREERDAVKAGIAAYFRGLADVRAREPGDDLFSEPSTTHGAGDLSRPDLISLSVMVVLNTLDQIRNQAATMVYALLTHPAQLAVLRADSALLPRAVEDLLRFVPQRNGVGLPRIATEDVVVGDVLIRAGDAVYVSYLAANRDPRVFTEPDRLDGRDPRRGTAPRVRQRPSLLPRGIARPGGVGGRRGHAAPGAAGPAAGRPARPGALAPGLRQPGPGDPACGLVTPAYSSSINWTTVSGSRSVG